MTETQLFWHFAQVDEQGTPRLGYKDNREVRVGETLTVEGEPVLCERGLHASAKLWDALGYAQGDKRALCRVTLGGTVKHDENKSVGNERTVVAMLDADATDKLLRDFARWCALQVIHLWDAPDVVRQYLETGDKSLRSAARAAAWYAARDAAGYAALYAAGDAAGDAAGYAAGYAAGDAAGDAAGYAARGAEIERYASELERRAMKALEAQVIP
jgi:hypothetical protein